MLRRPRPNILAAVSAVVSFTWPSMPASSSRIAVGESPTPSTSASGFSTGFEAYSSATAAAATSDAPPAPSPAASSRTAIAAPCRGISSGCSASSTNVSVSGAERERRCIVRRRAPPPAPPRAAGASDGSTATPPPPPPAPTSAPSSSSSSAAASAAAAAAATAARRAARREGVRGTDWRFSMQYHRFLTALSGRPGRRSAIALHLLPSSACAATSARSSASVHGPLFTVGSRLFTHRSRHCLALRPGTWPAISPHTLTSSPTRASNSTSSASSSGAHAPFTIGLLLCQNRRHASGVRPYEAMSSITRSHCDSPCSMTAARSASRSAGVHGSCPARPPRPDAILTRAGF
mmetsp:Transcript_22155/g.77652  ORF Transcript_22155/g.77652 Transcript_22155/m.77652 type:complete len:349 (-) Transcript_22155:512-1558(-)